MGVCAVVVTYYPCLLKLREQLDKIVNQVDKVVIVDNGSTAKLLSGLNALSEHYVPLNIISLPVNEGIAYAQNEGIKWAKANGSKFVILMDQDSVPHDGMVSHLLQSYLQYKGHNSVGAIGPRFIVPDSGIVRQHIALEGVSIKQVICDKGSDSVKVDFLIASGSLIPIEVLDHVGLMDSKLFIDHVDTEWCFRAKSMGYELLGDCQALMEHSLGERMQRVWYGKWGVVTVHKPFRYFYMFRNSLVLLRRSYMPFRWKIAQTIRLVKMFVLIGLLTDNRFSNLSMMLKGSFFGLLNNTKKRP